MPSCSRLGKLFKEKSFRFRIPTSALHAKHQSMCLQWSSKMTENEFIHKEKEGEIERESNNNNNNKNNNNSFSQDSWVLGHDFQFYNPLLVTS